ncbi:DinB family protein [Microbacterium sp. MPKO10]|uniref:DinB family protein n=1 Tax=Microbacterium sp. MPKO10 TaxID=2989818 RepID=UPI0022369959|nr:DinB family protein [Microbacterium sp. MPKO10]MCW4457222.1 DinB family protein [Microbacterium sp. MPKO10]
MTVIDDQGRPEPPIAATELDTLVGFLEYQRATFEWKCSGLDAAELNATTASSSMTLGGMMKHLALVEDSWFSEVLLGNEPGAEWRNVDWNDDYDWEWHSAADDSPERLRQVWADAVTHSRACVATALERDGLDTHAARGQRDGSHVTLRWILVHMIEEYARHNGHADLLREAIDGETGE